MPDNRFESGPNRPDISGDINLAELDFDLHLDTASPELVALLTRAEDLAASLREVPVLPETRAALNSLNIRRAVRGTTGIEGIEVTESEAELILRSEGPVLPASRAQTEHEVRNAAAVMSDIAEQLAREPGLPVTEALIARVHRLMTDGLPYEHNVPGVYRSHPVTVGRYSPPRSRDEIERLMREYVAWINGPARALHPIVRAIAAHFYLVSIHPFGDGNGRTSRAIESFVLYQSGMAVLGFYSLSNHYYRQQPEYVAQLQRVQSGRARDLTPFVLFGLRGFVDEMDEMWERVAGELRRVLFERLARAELIDSGQLRAKAAERMYQLAKGVVEPVSVAAIRDGTHPLARLYRELSDKTLTRDIAYLQGRALVLVEGGRLRANLALVRGE